MDDVKDKFKGMMKKMNNPFSSSSSGKFKGQGRVLGSSSNTTYQNRLDSLQNNIDKQKTGPMKRVEPKPRLPPVKSSDPVVSSLEKNGNFNAESDYPKGSSFDPCSPIISYRKSSQMDNSVDVFECPLCGTLYNSEEEVSVHASTCLDNSGRNGEGAVGSTDEKMELRNKCLSSIGTFMSGDPSKETVDVVLKLLKNIITDPNNAKFRRIRMTNPKIHDTVGSSVGGVELLECVGFRLQEEDGEMRPGSQHQHSEQQQPLAEAASPISSRPPARSANFEELLPVGVGAGFPDDEALAGEEAERGATGNRWPRQETLALLKIRSEMDAAFRDATLKGPLWEEVSRKLAESGFNRSAKKCKEKFENVHKYYKRTKEGRAGRQDGKSYRFFKQLEALHGNTGSTSNAISASAVTPVAVTTVAAPPAVAAAAVSTIHSSPVEASGVMGSATRKQNQPSSATTAAAQMASSQRSRPTIPGPPTLTRIPTDQSREISLSSGGSSTSGDSSEEIQEQSHRKRKRSSEPSTRKTMNFFEGLMKQVVEKQVALQKKFLETIEKREEDRMIREEAWKRQEMARLNKELDILAQERAMSASRDAAMIAFLQKFTGQTIHLPPPPQPPPPQQPAQAVSTTPLVTIPTVQPPQQQPHHNQHHQPPPRPSQQQQQVEIRPITSSSTDIVAHKQEPGSGGFETASSRWPKVEVLALIKLRSGLESRYQEAGPKGPLWEEISAEMEKMGYKRSAKRCKEKWENINKYFKKVKESNKKRPEDSKTCPYFHQLDALYRKKIFGGNSSKPDIESPREPSLRPEHHSGGDVLAIMPTPISAAPPEKEGGDGENGRGGDSGSAMLGQKGSNNNNNGAGFYSSVVEEGNGVGAKKPEDIVMGLMGRQLQHQAVMDMDDPDSDNVEADDDEDRNDEDDDDGADDEEEEVEREPRRRISAAYEAQYPRQGAPTSTGNAGSFITMVQ